MLHKSSNKDSIDKSTNKNDDSETDSSDNSYYFEMDLSKSSIHHTPPKKKNQNLLTEYS